jgi:hypothetical protein
MRGSGEPDGYPQVMTTTTVLESTQRLRKLALMMIGSLLIEFLVGMANTFWLETPESGSGWSSAKPMWLLMLHIIWGVAILVLAIWIFVIARKLKSSSWFRLNLVGTLGILVAIGGGSSFMGDVSSDVPSMVMSVGWAVALGAYAVGLFKTE